MAKKNYTVIYPIKHDGKSYKKGATLQMESEMAETLVQRGIIAPAKEAPVAANSGMPDPKVGQSKPPEGAAQQLTADPGIPPQGV